jgi:hypothetical protein
VAPMITGMTKHFIYIAPSLNLYTYIFLYFNFFSAPFFHYCLSDGIALFVSKKILSSSSIVRMESG